LGKKNPTTHLKLKKKRRRRGKERDKKRGGGEGERRKISAIVNYKNKRGDF